MEKKQTYKALSKICLNNWHYIDRKTLTLNQEINFFTGHSGSGKSTVIDALQIVLYANTDGRAFFNKAAADDSDRSLLEYLRGMINIGENNEVSYLRNKNFSSTIVLELENTKTKEQECIGIVFDVETTTNEISRLFFWHKGPLLERQYRWEERCMATTEIREYLQRNFKEGEQFYSANNERFRRQLYDVYLGGLDVEKFPRLFKRAIPFRMNIKIEDFVKEYICMEQDIHIEDMQESVMQYGRMRKKIEDTLTEIRELEDIRTEYKKFSQKEQEDCELTYRMRRLNMQQLEEELMELKERVEQAKEELKLQEQARVTLEEHKHELDDQYRDIISRIGESGYDQLKYKLETINEILERLEESKAKWQQIATMLVGWKEQEVISNQVIWDIESFEKETITENELLRLKSSLADIRKEVDDEQREYRIQLRELKKEVEEISEELKTLRSGEKGYPKIIEEARYELRQRLHERCGTFVNVHIMADLLQVRDEAWHQAIEGYLGHHKLAFIIEPRYVKIAMDIYQELDKKRFWKISIVDTEKVMQKDHIVRPGALAEEVKAKEPYVQSFLQLLLGNVMKCNSIEELRESRIGITQDCIIYQNYQLRRINPEQYTVRAYIGETSLRQRIKRLEEQKKQTQEKLFPLEELVNQTKKILSVPGLLLQVEDYTKMQEDMGRIKEKEKEKQRVQIQLENLKLESIDVLKKQEEGIKDALEQNREEIEKLNEFIWKKQEDIRRYTYVNIEKNEQLELQKREFVTEELFESMYLEYRNAEKEKSIESMRTKTLKHQNEIQVQKEKSYEALVDIRLNYLKKYANRTFSANAKDNKTFDRLLDEMQCEELEKFKEEAKEQAKVAIEHFKDDFIFKIRSAIKEAYQRTDELNRIINKLDFGKDKYQFKITKNKGADGEYYKMFMDDALAIDPSVLVHSMDNQMNIFTMEHEDHYGEMMNDLINIFIPPEKATTEDLELAKKNMDKYADYRTYLSFDMEQIVQGKEKLTIGLSKMISKNSGGEGQNPLYVALLASFAQAYRVGLSPKIQRSPTLRLVILDEAFSKMDSEKVASCIELIRGLGFQAIISATNDKIQNYLENVDKTFVFANPNKKSISIQEFEKTQFVDLTTEMDENNEVIKERG